MRGARDRRRCCDELRRTTCLESANRRIHHDYWAPGYSTSSRDPDEPQPGKSVVAGGALNSAPSLTRSQVRRESSSDTVYRRTRRTDELPNAQTGGPDGS